MIGWLSKYDKSVGLRRPIVDKISQKYPKAQEIVLSNQGNRIKIDAA